MVMQRFAKPYNRKVELVRLQYAPPISLKCYGSTSVSKTEGVGSTPTTGAIIGA